MKRAFCSRRPGHVVELAPLPYLERNRSIVNWTAALVATPGEALEQLRSGTWATVRYARKSGCPIRFFWPDGSSSLEDPTQR